MAYRRATAELDHQGFTIIPGPAPPEQMGKLAQAYDAVMATATGDDLKIGSTTTRVSDFVNRGAEFDDLYTFPPLLEACRQVIGVPFRLSSLLGRTLRPNQPAQHLHVDVRRDSADWPLLGFILMVDEFTLDNGATCFVAGSHRWPNAPTDEEPEAALACGPAGSMLIFNGSTWHGHTANTTNEPRRSIQGFYIPQGGRAATDFGARMSSVTRSRLSPLAQHVLALRE